MKRSTFLLALLLILGGCTNDSESRNPSALPFCPDDVRAQFEIGVKKGKCRPRQFEGSIAGPWRIR